MTAAMGGIDALVFTGGVGENSPRVRSAATAATGFLGVELDLRLNDEGKADALLSGAEAPVPVVLIQAREDIEIATQVRAALALSADG